MPDTVLLLGANDRACYSVAKSLKKSGYRIEVVNDSKDSIRYSRFVKQFYTIGTIKVDVETAVKNLQKILEAKKYRFIIPINDLALTLCFHYQSSIKRFTEILFINDPGVHEFASNKIKLWRIAADLELPVATTWIIEDLEQLNAVLKELKFPVIAKPASSKVLKNNKIFSYSVKIIKNKNELVDFVREKIETVPLLIQEVLKGKGGGFNFFSVNGELFNYYCHERINEAWGGGQSTYRKTISPHQYNLLAYSEKLVKAIGWTGIAMIEYKIQNEVPYIVELNGRSWGSIELGNFAKCSLPVDMVNYFAYNKKPTLTPFKEVYCRNFHNELFWIFKGVISQRSPGLFFRWLSSLRKSFRAKEKIEDSIFADPFFRLSVYVTDLKTFLGGFAEKMKVKWANRFLKTQSLSLSGGDKIAFVCKGNINRSPFAERYCKKNFPCLQVASFGTVFEQDRLSPINAITASEKMQVDMTDHRSRIIDKNKALEFDKIVVMDVENYFELRKLGIPKGKIFFLSKKKQIKDPYSHTQKEFEQAFAEIAASINQSIAIGNEKKVAQSSLT
jgi:protein-tyrosine-phosphatase/predicted ATP-grasp superfamily ATP-dependent carboligase